MGMYNVKIFFVLLQIGNRLVEMIVCFQVSIPGYLIFSERMGEKSNLPR